VGDLLREERSDPSSPDRETIDTHMKEGRIVPPELANRVLLRAIEKYALTGQKIFLVDGFPRSMEQATEFETVYIAFDVHINFLFYRHWIARC
jgi:UMP-CMP kinase